MLQPRDPGKYVEGHIKSIPPVARVQLHILLRQPQNGPCGYYKKKKETTISLLTTRQCRTERGAQKKQRVHSEIFHLI